MSDDFHLRDLINWLCTAENKKSGKVIFTKQKQAELYNQLSKAEGPFKSVLDFLLTRARPKGIHSQNKEKEKNESQRCNELVPILEYSMFISNVMMPPHNIPFMLKKSLNSMIRAQNELIRIQPFSDSELLQMKTINMKLMECVIRCQSFYLKNILARLNSTFVSVDHETVFENQALAFQDFQNMLKGPKYETRNIVAHEHDYVDKKNLLRWLEYSNSKLRVFIPNSDNEATKNFLRAGKEKLAQLSDVHVDLYERNKKRLEELDKSEDETYLLAYIQNRKNFERVNGQLAFLKEQSRVTPPLIELLDHNQDSINYLSAHVAAVLKSTRKTIQTAYLSQQRAERSLKKLGETATQIATQI